MSKIPPEDTSLNALPHAVGPEKSVLSCLLQDPVACFPQARKLGVTEASFHLPQHARLFMELERLHAAGQEIELVSFIQKLQDRGALDKVGGGAGLTDIFTYAFQTSVLPLHAGVLRDKELQRGMLHLCRTVTQAIYDEPEATGDHFKQATEGLRGLSALRSAASGSLRERAYLLRYDPASEPPPDEVCLLLGDIPVAARGNLTVLQGKSKVGKSAVVSAILGAVQAVGVARPGDCLGFRWRHAGEREPGAILHFDTEQSPSDWHALVSRSLRRAGVSTPPARLVSLPVVAFARSERLALLREALEHERRNGTGTDLVIIDGIADLCVSPNDEAEALEIVSQLMALAQEFGVAIICIIHENPGTEMAKTRGHLGSELNRKAFANLRIDKDVGTGISVIYGTDMRKREIPRSHGFCFGWDDAAGMHVFKGRNSAMKAEARERDAIAKAREEWERIFEAAGWTDGACPPITVKQAMELEVDIKGTGVMTAEPTMRKRMQRAEIAGVLRKASESSYVLVLGGQRGHSGGQDGFVRA